jgi:hypothetical protein
MDFVEPYELGDRQLYKVKTSQGENYYVELVD